MRFGLLQASFIPPKGPRDLRDLTRYRTKRVQERVREVHRVQGVLERAHITLASVIAAIMGAQGARCWKRSSRGEPIPLRGLSWHNDACARRCS